MKIHNLVTKIVGSENNIPKTNNFKNDSFSSFTSYKQRYAYEQKRNYKQKIESNTITVKSRNLDDLSVMYGTGSNKAWPDPMYLKPISMYW